MVAYSFRCAKYINSFKYISSIVQYNLKIPPSCHTVLLVVLVINKHFQNAFQTYFCYIHTKTFQNNTSHHIPYKSIWALHRLRMKIFNDSGSFLHSQNANSKQCSDPNIWRALLLWKGANRVVRQVVSSYLQRGQTVNLPQVKCKNMISLF